VMGTTLIPRKSNRTTRLRKSGKSGSVRVLI